MKNNATRLLQNRGIPFEAYELTPDRRSGLDTASLLGVPYSRVFKTLVLARPGNGKPILALIPVNFELDLKAVAREFGEKKIVLASQKEAERLTGLQVGGISPLALLHKSFETIIDRSAWERGVIIISAGTRGQHIELSISDLVDVIDARQGDITRNP